VCMNLTAASNVFLVVIFKSPGTSLSWTKNFPSSCWNWLILNYAGSHQESCSRGPSNNANPLDWTKTHSFC
jgi:hypothetical protein